MLVIRVDYVAMLMVLYIPVNINNSYIYSFNTFYFNKMNKGEPMPINEFVDKTNLPVSISGGIWNYYNEWGKKWISNVPGEEKSIKFILYN